MDPEVPPVLPVFFGRSTEWMLGRTPPAIEAKHDAVLYSWKTEFVHDEAWHIFRGQRKSRLSEKCGWLDAKQQSIDNAR